MTPDEPRFPPDDLRIFAAALLRSAGTREPEAGRIAAHLVDANLAGHDSHGVGLLPAYLDHARKGLVECEREAVILKDSAVLFQLDAGRSWGAPAGDRLTSALADKAEAEGLACGTIANAHHLGRIGAYAEALCERGLVSVHFVNVTDHAPLVAPFRGSDARFGTNPVCIGFPGLGERPHFVLDMATSIIALGKVRVAAAKGVTVPPGTLLNEQGMPTTDPTGMAGFEIRGALTPLGRHKGYGLAYACELLAGLLSRGGTIQPGNTRRDAILNSMLSFVIDPAAFAEPGWMAEESEALAGFVTQSPPMDWDSPVLVPGDSERAWRGKRTREGIPLARPTIEALNAIAAEQAIPPLDAPVPGKLS